MVYIYIAYHHSYMTQIVFSYFVYLCCDPWMEQHRDIDNFPINGTIPVSLVLDHNIISWLMNLITVTSYASNIPKYNKTYIKRSHCGTRKKWPYKTGDLFKEVPFIWNIQKRTSKWWPFNTCDCLIEVTAWAGLTILWNKHEMHTKLCTISERIYYLKLIFWLWTYLMTAIPEEII